jgi:hypothetical protein
MEGTDTLAYLLGVSVTMKKSLYNLDTSKFRSRPVVLDNVPNLRPTAKTIYGRKLQQ